MTDTIADPEPTRWTWRDSVGKYITLTFPADVLICAIAGQWYRRDGAITAWYDPDQLELAMTAALAWLEARAARRIEGLRAGQAARTTE